MVGENGSPRPFLKWAGGKAQILPKLLRRVPREFKAYHEPFLGGGALFFALVREGRLEGKKVFLSDSNPDLANAFQVVRDNPEKLLDLLKDYQRKNTREEYYRIRSGNPHSPVRRAARLIYLNRTCYNGLYRVNSRGQFNVPYGRYKNPRIYDPENILAVSRALQGVEITCDDFESVLSRAKPGDFVYFDPPYYPLSPTASFSDYTPNGFSDEDHIRLAWIFRELAEMGVLVMESNSDTRFVRELYTSVKAPEPTVITIRRLIGARAERRNLIKELLFTSY